MMMMMVMVIFLAMMMPTMTTTYIKYVQLIPIIQWTTFVLLTFFHERYLDILHL